jgi:hypothetical protein
MEMMRILPLLTLIWALPWTSFGVLIGITGLATGGGVQRSGKTVEFWGGAVSWFLRTFPLVSGASAVTFGHCILGRSQSALSRCRDHERVHVRQYERWGPAFVPAYLFHWVRLRIAGHDPYWDNPFEKQAFDEAPEPRAPSDGAPSLHDRRQPPTDSPPSFGD